MPAAAETDQQDSTAVYKPTQQAGHARVLKRLLPLYVAAFMQGFVLWYAIEKLFMTRIGFDEASLGLMVAVYSAAQLLVETPSGILADRWSRKGVLIIGSIALTLSSLVGGLSHNVPIYLAAAVLWGIFFAMYSGTYDSVVYDTVKEETGNAKGFSYYLGRLRMFDSVALVISSLAGGVLATLLDIRAPYFATLIPCLLSIAALAAFREPQLHHAKPAEPLRGQILATFRSLARNRFVLLIVITNMLLMFTMQMYFEFDQLWLIALLAPVSLYGVVNAMMLSGGAVGGFLAGRLNLRLKRYFVPLLALLVAASVTLSVTHDLIVAVIAVAIVGFTLMTANIVYTGLLHDELSSDIRAGAA